MLYILFETNDNYSNYQILKRYYQNKRKYIFLKSDFNNDNFKNIVYKINAFIKIINNSTKPIFFLNGFFIKPSLITEQQYEYINKLIDTKLKKIKIKYIYQRLEPKQSFLNSVYSYRHECCICLEENDIVISCAKCNEGKLCYKCYEKYNKDNCCICNTEIHINDIKKKEISFFNRYYDYNIYIQQKKNVIVI